MISSRERPFKSRLKREFGTHSLLGPRRDHYEDLGDIYHHSQHSPRIDYASFCTIMEELLKGRLITVQVLSELTH